MSLPSAWVDALFAKLTLRYGAAFLAQWPDADPAALKTDWADVMAGFAEHPHAIRYALENLPEKPMNAVAFRLLARRAPAKEVPQLAAPPADPARVAKAIETARVEATRDTRSHAQMAIDGIIRRVESNGWSVAQRSFARTCGAALHAEDPRRARMAQLGLLR